MAASQLCGNRETGAAPSAYAASGSEARRSVKTVTSQIAQHFAARDWTNNRRSLVQVACTLPAFVAGLAAMAATVEDAYWATLLLAIPTAGLLVRLFIFQHDCGHGSFFSSRAANGILGRLISIFTMTPYEHWKRSHAAHHATSGNLDDRGKGDVPTITLNEYREMSPLGRLGYRIFRHPVFLLGVGVPINFIILQRFPLGEAARDPISLRSIAELNVMMLAVYGGAMALFGIAPVVAVYLPVIVVAAAIGGWLFFIQHNYEEAYWRHSDDWTFHEASLAGSSYYDLPAVLHWFTGNIGYHHIHHLCCRVPNHRLRDCMTAFPELNRGAKRLSLRESFGCWKFALWDDDARQMISFKDAERSRS
ncbi:MAG: fatty acid desaturase [Alphaproteobacteria bacterium]|nr:fatty acid desaturase [Alphaproteobacteria bacterium]